ncbi:MAG: tRNA pseudouridine(38-40) synthase TruA [Verrucomicrobia bacterium]|nr:tRNA pseudouridine(38-40) synthase TruA [Verrucomicrobiota bacterium]
MSDREDRLRIKIVVAYDGAPFAGWQVQKTGVGVQEKLEEALRRLFPGLGRIQGSSRTDTGVHARGMVAHFDVLRSQFRMTPRKLVLAVNAHLPESIRVMRAARVSGCFHARFDASCKEYRYFVWNHPAHDPLRLNQVWHVPRPLNLTAMRKTATLLVGRHDFKAFAAQAGYPVHSTVRTLTRLQVTRSGALLTFRVEGDGFLYKMCRGIVGTLVQVGLGKLGPDSVLAMLASRDRRLAGMTAPAHGLVLWRVAYAGGARDPRGLEPVEEGVPDE